MFNSCVIHNSRVLQTHRHTQAHPHKSTQHCLQNYALLFGQTAAAGMTAKPLLGLLLVLECRWTLPPPPAITACCCFAMRPINQKLAAAVLLLQTDRCCTDGTAAAA
jgi:hypothetical protein